MAPSQSLFHGGAWSLSSPSGTGSVPAGPLLSGGGLGPPHNSPGPLRPSSHPCCPDCMTLISWSSRAAPSPPSLPVCHLLSVLRPVRQAGGRPVGRGDTWAPGGQGSRDRGVFAPQIPLLSGHHPGSARLLVTPPCLTRVSASLCPPGPAGDRRASAQSEWDPTLHPSRASLGLPLCVPGGWGHRHPIPNLL